MRGLLGEAVKPIIPLDEATGTILYRVGDHVLLKGGDSHLEDHSERVVVHIEGSTLMLKRGYQVIRDVHADEVAPSLDFVKRAPTASAGTGSRAVLVA